MPAYVDDLQETHIQVSLGKWPYREFCHLTADTIRELHDMAERIGLKREWFQPHRSYPHYDLTKNKRTQAVKAGAIEQFRPVKAKGAKV